MKAKDALGPFVLLLLAIVNLAVASEVWLFAGAMGLASTLAWKLPADRLNKWLVYGALVPFSLWWFLAPTTGRFMGISWWFFFIPSWYFLWLAFLQFRALGRGGEHTYIWWNTAAAMVGAGIRPSEAYFWLLAIYFAALVLHLRFMAVAPALGIPGHSNLQAKSWGVLWRPAFVFKWIAVLLLGVALAWQWSLWRGSVEQWMVSRSRYNPENRQMRGFDPVSFLGSFGSSYAQESRVALLVYSAQEPRYMVGMTYAKYLSGYWRQHQVDSVLFATRNLLEYGVFSYDEAADSVPMAWVSPQLGHHGLLFHPPFSRTIAYVADSLQISKAGVFRTYTDQESSRGWHIFTAQTHGEFTAADLQVPPDAIAWLDSLWEQVDSNQSNPLSGADSVSFALQSLSHWFQATFTYSLQVPGVQRGHGQEPLRQFVQHRQGYCEYFATLSTLMLRHRGIPARYAAGYAYPSRFSENNGPWVFRQRDAHAWVHVLHPQNGWIIHDPTPPTMRPESLHVSAITKWTGRVSAAWRYQWHRLRDGDWKLALDRMERITRLVLQSMWFYGSVLVLVLILVGRRVLKRITNRPPVDAHSAHWIALLTRAERKLARYGIVRMPGETVHAFLQRCDGLVTDDTRSAWHDLQMYQKQRFALATFVSPKLEN